MVDRRAFVGTLASGILASSYAALAQQSTKLYRIGVLGGNDGAPWQAFARGLRELGYVEGRNITVEWRFSEGRTDRFSALAEELVQSKMDIIVAGGTQAVRAAKDATDTIPIVMAVSAYPDKIGLVESLARPGGNVTGLSNVSPELMGKRFQLLKEIAPKVSRVAVLWNPASPVEPNGFRETLAAAPIAGMAVQSIEVRTPEDYPAAFATMTQSRVDALFPFGNPVNFRHLQLIVDYALTNRLPSLFDERLFVESGGLLSYGPNFIDLFHRAATYVDKILKGTKAGDLPVEQPVKVELLINLKTAKALGLAIPQSMRDRGFEEII